MGSKYTLSVFLVACLAAGVASRELLANSCPAGCAPGKCIQDKTSGKFRCTKCNAGMVVVKGDRSNTNFGTCECRPGRYWEATGGEDDVLSGVPNPKCSLCTKGSWCPGGNGAGVKGPQTACGDFLTTKAMGASSKWQCVELPGYGYSVVGSAPTATPCTGSKYNPGYAKKACTACPAGFQINFPVGDAEPAYHDSIADCQVPPGYYMRNPGEAAPCPQGEYTESYNNALSCTACPEGTTTVPAVGRVYTSAQFCVALKPGYFAKTGQLTSKTITDITTGSDNYLTAATKCPQKHWCPGGVPTTTYDEGGAPGANTMMVSLCSKDIYGAPTGTAAYPMWTKGLGATSVSECLVPPGYGVTGEAVTVCSAGYFRGGWAQGKPACQLCADGPDGSITSAADAQLTTFTTAGVEGSVDVITSAAACAMSPGYGMYQKGDGYKVLACNSNSYGSPNIIYGRGVSPCRSCPTNMVTDTPSVVPGVSTATGHISPLACKTQAGYGYDGVVSTQCPVGTYNDAGNRAQCEPCPYGFTTADAAVSQITQSDCYAAPGFKQPDAQKYQAEQCEVGTYANAMATLNERTRACSTCAGDRTTEGLGADDASDCTLCKDGYGLTGEETGCSLCDAKSPAAYGPPGRTINDLACVTCPTMTQGFRFIYNGAVDSLTAAPVAKSPATSQGDCVAQFAQIESGLFYLAGATDTPTAAAADAAACRDACRDENSSGAKICMFFTFDYADSSCKIRKVPTESPADALLAFKATPSGDITGAASKALASGWYTYWSVKASTVTSDDDAKIGVQASVTAGTVGACVEACDKDDRCAAVIMAGITAYSAQNDVITGCTKIKGVNEPPLTKRSLTHAVKANLH